MFPVIEFNRSALKHGITENNIRHALWHPLYEVAYNIIDDDTINVFHAMPCRKKFISQLNL